MLIIYFTYALTPCTLYYRKASEATTMKKIYTGLIQILMLCFFSYMMEALSTFFNLPIPGSILGLIILFILLQTNTVHLKWLEAGGNWLVAELLLFFVPSAVGILQYHQLLFENGIKIILIIISSSAVVMICSGLLAEYMSKRKRTM